MKKDLNPANTKLPFDKERITLLSDADLDHIIGGFQLEPHEYLPVSLTLDGLCPPLAGHSPLGYASPQSQ